MPQLAEEGQWDPIGAGGEEVDASNVAPANMTQTNGKREERVDR